MLSETLTCLSGRRPTQGVSQRFVNRSWMHTVLGKYRLLQGLELLWLHLPLLTMLQAVVVSKQSLENWLARNQTHLPRANDEDDGAPEELSISDILCEHGALDPSRASNMKCINEVSAAFARRYCKLDKKGQGAYDKILASGCNLAPLLHTDNVCSICVTQTYQGP